MLQRFALPVLLLLACSVVILILFSFLKEHEAFGFPLDDGWIHARYAHNLAEYGEFSFNRGELSTGTTSFFWTLLIAIGYSISGHIVLAAHFYGIVSLFLLLIVLYHLTSEIFSRWSYGFASGVLALGSGFMLWWTLSGMETMLFLALAICAIVFYTKKRTTLSAISLSLLTLTRPEGMLLVVIIAIHRLLVIHREKIPKKHFAKFGFASSIGLLVYMAWNYILTGHFVTSTLAGRRWLANAPASIPIDPVFHLKVMLTMIVRWSRMIIFTYVPETNAIGIAAAGVFFAFVSFGIITLLRPGFSLPRSILNPLFIVSFIILLLSVVPATSFDAFLTQEKSTDGFVDSLVRLFELSGSGLTGKRMHILSLFIGSLLTSLSAMLFALGRLRKKKKFNPIPTPFKIFLLWCVLHNLLYVIVIPYPGHGGRYQANNIVLLVLLFLFGISRWNDALTMRVSRTSLRRALIAASLTIVAIPQLYALDYWGTVYFSTVQHINSVHKQSALWAARYLPRNARIAAFDIGAMGYFSNRYIIDIGGLISSEPIPYMEEKNIDSYIARSSATHLAMIYLFDEGDTNESLGKRLGIHTKNYLALTPLYESRFDTLAWRKNVQLTGNAYPVLRIFEIAAHAHTPVKN